jgi:hypothetical protein
MIQNNGMNWQRSFVRSILGLMARLVFGEAGATATASTTDVNESFAVAQQLTSLLQLHVLASKLGRCKRMPGRLHSIEIHLQSTIREIIRRTAHRA